jgi:hypothetical protein
MFDTSLLTPEASSAALGAYIAQKRIHVETLPVFLKLTINMLSLK